MSTDLANRATVTALVAAFQEAERDVRAAFKVIVAAEARVNLVFLGDGGNATHIRITANHSGHGENFERPDLAIKRMERKAWEAIVERLELKRMCAIERWKQVKQRLEKEELPAISVENVTAFVTQYADEAPAMIREAIGEVYDWLRPRGPRERGPGSPKHPDRYAANRVIEIPEKVILTRFVEAADKWGWNPRGGVSTQELTALENIFLALDGRGTVKGYYSALELAIREAGTKGEAETDLFRVRYYRNGNGHLWFKRADLLKRFNALAGGKNLRPGQAA